MCGKMQEFFETFGIKPIMLCNCEFKNLYDYQLEYGQDVCIHMEEDNACDNCELAKQDYPLYPEISSRKLLRLLCLHNSYCKDALIPTDFTVAKEYILNKMISAYKNNEYTSDIKDEIREIL